MKKINPAVGPGWGKLHILRRLSPPVSHFLAEAPTLLVGHLHPFIFPRQHFLASFTTKTPVELLPFMMMPMRARPTTKAAEKYFAQNKQTYRLPVVDRVKVGGSRQNGIPKPLYNCSESEGCDQDKNR